MARRVFTTASYNPGLQRVGDFYYSEGAYWEAFRVYTQASVPEKKDYMIQQMAKAVGRLLRQSPDKQSPDRQNSATD